MKKILLFLLALLIVGCDYAPNEHTHDTTHEHGDIYGCTDSTAINYDADANIFDNSCFYSESEGQVRMIQVGVLEKMYTDVNSNWVTVHYDDIETNHNTVVLFASYLNIHDMWVNVEVFDSYFSSTGYMCSDEYSYDDKCGFAALIWDPDEDLIGKELRLWYIP